MATLPATTTISPTVLAIYRAYEAENSQRDGKTISVSTLADECARKLFYDFRWVSDQEKIEGRTLRIFETGNIEEERWLENLRKIGCEVVDRADDGNQIRVNLCGGHVGGYLDCEVLGLPEAPKTWHVGEIKSHNLKSFTALKRDGVRKSKPLHFGQIQTYMHARGRDRGIYLAVCKDNDELYAERLHLDVDYVLRLLARAERIIESSEPPRKLHEDPSAKMAFACSWCKHADVCHRQAMPRVNCRTCLHSQAERDGRWSCSRWMKPLSLEEQKEGCPNHLFCPSLVPFEQVDVDEENERVIYKTPSGELWIDGASA